MRFRKESIAKYSTKVISIMAIGIVMSAAMAWTSEKSVAATANTTNPTVCSDIAVGPEQEVVSNTSRAKVGTWTDIQQGVLRNKDGSYEFLGTAATGGTAQRPQRPIVTHGTLDNPLAYGTQTVAAIANVPTGYSWVGGGPVYRDTTSGTILQIMHLEKLLSDGTHYYTQLALGKVNPTTYQTTYLGMIIQPNVSYASADSAKASVDLGAPSLVVRDGYLYAYFNDFYLQNNIPTMRSPAVARTSLSSALSAAQNGKVSAWQKYTGSATWTSNAMGGASSSLTPDQPALWAPNTAYNAELGSTVMISPVSPTKAVLTSSVDGMTNWTNQQPLFSDPDHFNAYYTLVGTGDDPSQLGRQFYVYYLQWQSPTQDWSNARILRRSITCTNGQTATKKSFIRYTNVMRHITTTSQVTQPGYYSEHSGTWQLFTAAQAGTHALYSCRLGTQDNFTYTQADCGGFAIIQTEGWIYDNPPSEPSVALYRCYQSSIGDHFITESATCEDTGANNDGLIGYAPVSTRVVMGRYFNGSDHWDTTGAVTNAYQNQRQWSVEANAAPNTVQIFTCQYATPLGTEHFTSTRSDCEGATVTNSEGWLYTMPPVTNALPMYRCYDATHYDHFLATDTTCEGIANAKAEGLLGYASY